jgi:hypothetical protein
MRPTSSGLTAAAVVGGVIALILTPIASTRLASTTRAQSVDVDPYLYGSAGISRTKNSAEVGNSSVTANSRIFLTVDTTSVPGGDVAEPGIRLNNHGQGWFTVSTLDEANAVNTTGVPFSYLVVNQPTGTFGPLTYTTGAAVLPAGSDHMAVPAPAADAHSTVLLTVDASSLDEGVHLDGLKVNNKGAGGFTVTTLDLKAAGAHGIPFNWIVVNGGGGLRGHHTISTGHNVGVDSTAFTRTAGVFVTTDATTVGGATDVSLPGVKVNNHGDGFFTVTTLANTAVHSGGVPFDWIVVPPPHRWEEYGPTAFSGNDWTIAVDPSNPKIVYTGSNWGGVWKTVDGGQSWQPSWEQTLVGILQLALSPRNDKTIYALDFDLRVWKSGDAGGSWAKIAEPAFTAQQAGDTRFGAVMRIDADESVWVCSNGGGLAVLKQNASTWAHVGPSNAGTKCTDVVLASDGSIYAAFMGSGVYEVPHGGSSWQSIDTDSAAITNPIRLAVSGGEIALNAEGHVYTSSVSTPTKWADRGLACSNPDSQTNYNLALAISPTDPNHIVALAGCGGVSRDGGKTFKRMDEPSLDQHQVVFIDDSHLAMAADHGPRFSANGGMFFHDFETEGAQDSRIIDGPPTVVFYGLDVSPPDRFGREVVDGNSQDLGALEVIGNRFGMGGPGGEIGLSVSGRPLANDATESNEFGMISSTVDVYNVDTSAKNCTGCATLLRTQYVVPGPYFDAPTTQAEEFGPGANKLGSIQFPANIDAIATDPADPNRVFVGLANGAIYESTTGMKLGCASAAQCFTKARSGVVGVAVSTIDVVSSSLAYVGYANGKIGALGALSSAFGTSTFTPLHPSDLQQPILTIARSGSRLYIAQSGGVSSSSNGSAPWGDITGPKSSGPGAQIAGGTSIVGLAVDEQHGYVYVATGVRFLHVNVSSLPSPQLEPAVWRKKIDAAPSAAWDPFSTGLPPNIPVSGIAIAAGGSPSGTDAIPEQALFISTVGRGIWWRRDLG